MSRAFIPSFGRRHRPVPEAVAVAAPEIKPLEWTSRKKKQCEWPGCEVVFFRMSGERVCPKHRKAYHAAEALKESRTPKARARQLNYRETNRDTLRAKTRGPGPAKKQRDRYAVKKAAKPPVWNTCRWWTAVAEGALIKDGDHRCPARGGQFQVNKRKDEGFCSEQCNAAFIKDYKRNWITPNPQTKSARQNLANRKFRKKNKKSLTCTDCGKEFPVPMGSRSGFLYNLCPDCRKKPRHVKAYNVSWNATGSIGAGFPSPRSFRLKLHPLRCSTVRGYGIITRPRHA